MNSVYDWIVAGVLAVIAIIVIICVILVIIQCLIEIKEIEDFGWIEDEDGWCYNKHFWNDELRKISAELMEDENPDDMDSVIAIDEEGEESTVFNWFINARDFMNQVSREHVDIFVDSVPSNLVDRFPGLHFDSYYPSIGEITAHTKNRYFRFLLDGDRYQMCPA